MFTIQSFNQFLNKFTFTDPETSSKLPTLTTLVTLMRLHRTQLKIEIYSNIKLWMAYYAQEIRVANSLFFHQFNSCTANLFSISWFAWILEEFYEFWDCFMSFADGLREVIFWLKSILCLIRSPKLNSLLNA